MKKNNMLRLASVLLVAVLLSTCAVSGVFAYYQVGDDYAEQSAVVAKWGVGVTVTDGDAFSKFYKDTALTENTAEATVAGAVEVVAPGTNGSFGTVQVTDKATREVDMTGKVVVDLELTDWDLGDAVDATEYCPLVFTVNGAPIKFVDTVANFELAVEAAIAKAILGDAAVLGAANTYTAYYEAGVASTAAANGNAVEITWAWAFGEDTDPDIDTIIANDTILGNDADNGEAAEIALNYTVTFTQVN